MPETHVSEEDWLALEKAAEREERPVSDVLHAAILDYTSGWRRQRDQHLDLILEADTKLLRKLGSS